MTDNLKNYDPFGNIVVAPAFARNYELYLESIFNGIDMFRKAGIFSVMNRAVQAILSLNDNEHILYDKSDNDAVYQYKIEHIGIVYYSFYRNADGIMWCTLRDFYYFSWH